MLQPLAAPRRLACGTAAISFDPLCGEGTGNAVREAFLAAAVVRAALSGGDAEALAAHYTSRLQLGFLRHLQICQQFYNSGGHGEFWDAESDALRRGIGTLAAELQNQPAPRYRLMDRTLFPMEA
jgi:flavin-dependent dehydrogenase